MGVIYKKAEPTVRVTSKKTKPTVSAFFKKATPAVCSTSKAMLMLVTPMWRLLWRAQSPGHHVLVRTMWIVDPPSINRRRGKKCTYHAHCTASKHKGSSSSARLTLTSTQMLTFPRSLLLRLKATTILPPRSLASLDLRTCST